MRILTPPVMIFAAGFGTRMGALTAATPKPLIKVGEKTLLDHALDQIGDPAARVVVNVHYLGEQVIDHLTTRPDIRISDERDKILETGGGLRKAMPLLDATPVVTLNSDMVWVGPPAIPVLTQQWDAGRMDALMLLIPTNRAHGHKGQGSFAMDDTGHLTRGGDWIYTGAQIIRPDRLDEIQNSVFSLNTLWDLMLADGRVHGVVYPGHWADVGSPEGLAAAETLMAESHV